MISDVQYSNDKGIQPVFLKQLQVGNGNSIQMGAGEILKAPAVSEINSEVSIFRIWNRRARPEFSKNKFRSEGSRHCRCVHPK